MSNGLVFRQCGMLDIGNLPGMSGFETVPDMCVKDVVCKIKRITNIASFSIFRELVSYFLPSGIIWDKSINMHVFFSELQWWNDSKNADFTVVFDHGICCFSIVIKI